MRGLVEAAAEVAGMLEINRNGICNEVKKVQKDSWALGKDQGKTDTKKDLLTMTSPTRQAPLRK